MKKKLFFVQILGVEKLFKFVLKSAGEIFLSGLRGANFFFKRVSDRFFGSFFAFFKPFFVST